METAWISNDEWVLWCQTTQERGFPQQKPPVAMVSLRGLLKHAVVRVCPVARVFWTAVVDFVDPFHSNFWEVRVNVPTAFAREAR